MDLDQLLSLKNISDSSKKLYKRNLEKLNDNKPIKNFKFLASEQGVLEKLAKYKPNTQRSFIIAIVSTLKCLMTNEPNKWKRLYEKYYKILDKFNKELRENKSKNDKETDNWVTKEEIQKVYTHYEPIIEMATKKKSLSDREFRDLTDMLVLGLYTMQPPRRNQDYQHALICKKFDRDLLNNYNIVDINSDRFYFSKYKTKGTYNIQEQPIGEDIKEILNLYVKHHPLKKKLTNKTCIPFLVSPDGTEMNHPNDITRILYRVFQKKVGSSLLRKVYLTSKYGDLMKEMEADTEAMGTSTGTAQNHYIKDE